MNKLRQGRRSMKSTHEVLVEARNRLDTVGWCGSSPDSDGRGDCAWLAIAVGGRAATQEQATEILCRLLGVLTYHGLIDWNDCPERTKVEVLALFDEAIAATAPPPPEFDLKVPDHIAIVVEDIHARR